MCGPHILKDKDTRKRPSGRCCHFLQEWWILIFYAGPQIPTMNPVQEGEIESFNIPCEIENDVNCAGLAEVSGSGKGASVILA